jgi:hypothetical protein
MGLEAKCSCRCNGSSGEVKALLETRELILRGEVRRSFRIAEVTGVRVENDNLCFRALDDEIALRLGRDVAQRWAKKMTTPPPSLAQKLGVGPSTKVLVIGSVEDPALIAALADSTADRAKEARLSLAVVDSETILKRALRIHETLPLKTPIWIIHGKGPNAAFGQDSVRRLMREAGYKDSKISGVSDNLSATRYARQ